MRNETTKRKKNQIENQRLQKRNINILGGEGVFLGRKKRRTHTHINELLVVNKSQLFISIVVFGICMMKLWDRSFISTSLSYFVGNLLSFHRWIEGSKLVLLIKLRLLGFRIQIADTHTFSPMSFRLPAKCSAFRLLNHAKCTISNRKHRSK